MFLESLLFEHLGPLPLLVLVLLLCAASLKHTLTFLALSSLLLLLQGLKTGMYYLRTRAAADAIKFTVDQESLLVNQKKPEASPAAALMSPSRSQGSAAAAQQQMMSPAPAALAGMSLAGADGMTHEEREAQLARMVCSLENKDACLMCGS